MLMGCRKLTQIKRPGDCSQRKLETNSRISRGSWRRSALRTCQTHLSSRPWKVTPSRSVICDGSARLIHNRSLEELLVTAEEEKEASKPGFRSTFKRVARSKISAERALGATSEVQDAYNQLLVRSVTATLAQVVLMHETGRVEYLALSAAGNLESESQQAGCKGNPKAG